MNPEELKAACLEMIETAPCVHVTTVAQDGYPHTRAMFNLRNKEHFPLQAHLFEAHRDDFMILLSTNTSSSKLRQIQANPKVSLYYCHPAELHGLMLSGDMEIMDDSALRHALWNEGWERYYPGGPDDPDHTVLRLLPRSAEGWYSPQRFEFRIGADVAVAA